MISSLYIGIGNQTILSHQPAFTGLLFYGGIFAVLALILGLILRIMTRKPNRSTSWVGGIGILSGALGLLTLMIITIFG